MYSPISKGAFGNIPEFEIICRYGAPAKIKTEPFIDPTVFFDLFPSQLFVPLASWYSAASMIRLLVR